MHRVVTYTEKMTVQLWGGDQRHRWILCYSKFCVHFARSFFRQMKKYGLSTIFHQDYLNVKNETRGKHGAPKNWSIACHAYKKLINQITNCRKFLTLVCTCFLCSMIRAIYLKSYWFRVPFFIFSKISILNIVLNYFCFGLKWTVIRNIMSSVGDDIFCLNILIYKCKQQDMPLPLQQLEITDSSNDDDLWFYKSVLSNFTSWVTSQNFSGSNECFCISGW